MKECKIIGKRNPSRTRVDFWANEQTRAHLERLKAFYVEHLGRSVSGSIIMRRALEKLVEQVGQLTDENQIRDELLTLIKHAE